MSANIPRPQSVRIHALPTARPRPRSVRDHSGDMTRGSRFDYVSAAGASISWSPRHPSALQIDPPAASEDWPLGFRAWTFGVIGGSHFVYVIHLRPANQWQGVLKNDCPP